MLVHAFHVRLVPLADQSDLADPLTVGLAQRLEQVDEFLPCDARVVRWLVGVESRERVIVGDEVVQRLLRIRGAHARHELQDAESRELIARVVGPAQHGEQVLDVRGLEELEAPVLHERNLALGEFDFQHVAVRAGAEQHRLATQRHAGLARGQHPRADEFRLRGQVFHRHHLGTRPLAAHGQQVLAVLPGRIRHERVGCIQDALARTEVLRQRHHFGLGAEAIGEAQDVLHGGGAERVDGLGVVTHHRHALPVRLQRHEDVALKLVGVLVLVDQHVIEVRANGLGDAVFAHHRVPVQQQVVEIEHAVL